MARNSEHNIERNNIWENTFLTNFPKISIREIKSIILSQETFCSTLLDDNNVYENWERKYKESLECLTSLRKELKAHPINLQQSFNINFPTQDKKMRFYKKFDNLKSSLENLPKKFDVLDDKRIICSFENGFRLLGSIVDLSLTNDDIDDKFQKDKLDDKVSRLTRKDNLSKKVSDKVVLSNLSQILTLFIPKKTNFNILTEDFTNKINNLIKEIDTSNLSHKEINTKYFIKIYDYLLENIKCNIPFSDEIFYLITFMTYIDSSYDKIKSLLTDCRNTIKAIRPFITYYNNYNKNNIDKDFLKKISSLFFNLPIDKTSLNSLEKKWKDLLDDLAKSKEKVIVEYEKLLPKIVSEIALENEYSETMFVDNELSMTTNDILASLQNNGKDLNRYYAFVSNFEENNNFDKICFIIDSLASMKKEVSDSFIQIFMNKVHLKTEFKNIKTDVTSNDIKALVNRAHLSGSSLEYLTNILFFDRSEEEWSFLFHLPLIEIENKEWFEDFYSMLKIYCK